MNIENTPAIIAKAFFNTTVRTLVIGDNIWMHCIDVMSALGYLDVKCAVSYWMPTRKKIGTVLQENLCPTGQGAEKSWGGCVPPPDFSTEIGHNNWKTTNFIDEEGLYDCLMDCHAPKAKEFRRWVVADVLPSIRKTGQYSINQIEPEPSVIEPQKTTVDIAATLLDEVDRTMRLVPKLAGELRNALSREAELATQLGYNGYYTQAQIRQCNRWMGTSKVHAVLNALSAQLGHEVRQTRNYGTTVFHNMYAVEVWRAYAARINKTLVLPPEAQQYALTSKATQPLRLKPRLPSGRVRPTAH